MEKRKPTGAEDVVVNAAVKTEDLPDVYANMEWAGGYEDEDEDEYDEYDEYEEDY